MTDPALSIVTWNVEWQPARSRKAEELRHRIFATNPHVICLTEAYTDFLPAFGHVVAASPDHGYPIKEGRRKVLLWSRKPWRNIDQIGDEDMPSGRFVAARTETPIGEIDVIGVCIPWAAAHVSTGRKDRQRWDDHLQYLAGLNRVLAGRDRRTIIAGDFNQRIPRRGAPQAVYDALDSTVLRFFAVPTMGRIAPLDELAIDHIAHSSDLVSRSVTGLSHLVEGGPRLSDHFGLHVELFAARTPESLGGRDPQEAKRP
mgnify:CR=1 FL=1